MSAAAEVNVTTTDGIRGTIDTRTWPLDGSRRDVLLHLEDGRSLMTPVELLTRQADGTFRLSLAGTDLAGLDAALESAGGRRLTVPVVEERLLLGKREVETGRVIVRKRVVEEQQVVDQPLSTEEVTVERVAVGKLVDGRGAAEWQEGNTLVIPVFEEVLVVEKRLMLKEEVRVTRKTSEVRHREEAMLRHEVVEIERVDVEKLDEMGGEGTSIA